MPKVRVYNERPLIQIVTCPSSRAFFPHLRKKHLAYPTRYAVLLNGILMDSRHKYQGARRAAASVLAKWIKSENVNVTTPVHIR